MASVGMELSLRDSEGTMAATKERRESSGTADDDSPPTRQKSYTRGEGKWLVQHHNSLRELEKRASTRKSLGSSSRKLNFGSLRHLGSSRSLDSSNGPQHRAKSLPKASPKSVLETAPASEDDEAKPRHKSAPPQSTVVREGSDKQQPMKKVRTVTFSTCTFRYYETILGDNPFCSSGPSLSIGWNYDPSITDSDIPVDYIEELRSPQRKSEWDLMLSHAERERRLLDRGFSRDSIAKAVTESRKIKNQRRQTILNLRVSGTEEFLEGVTKKSKKTLHLRKGSSHLYNEWHQGTYKPPSPSKKQASPRNTVEPTDDDGNNMDIDSKTSFEPSEKVEEEKIARSNSSLMQKEGEQNTAFGISKVSSQAILDYVENEENDGEKHPFAIVDSVFSGSPADEAGLQRGDKLMCFGGVTKENNKNLMLVGELAIAASSREKSIPVVLLRDGLTHELNIRPRLWEGRGHLGFLLRPYSDA